MKKSILLLLAIGCISAGCQTGVLSNPDEPSDLGTISPDVMSDQLKCISDNLLQHVLKREITEPEYKALMRKAADEILTGFVPEKIDASKAWKYGEVLITAKKWEDAKIVLQVAVETARSTRNEDRRVNDSLRLARVQAELGDVSQAIKTARTVFDAKPVDGAPILLATELEIVPAARGKGKDLELAKLVEDAIAIHVRVQVDPNTDEGKSFLGARSFHLAHAWKTCMNLYESAKRPDLADAARVKAEAMGHDFSQNFSQSV